MQGITTIGLDIAKAVFQVDGVDVEGKVLVRRKLKRRYARQPSWISAALRVVGVIAPRPCPFVHVAHSSTL
jgi:transposase